MFDDVSGNCVANGFGEFYRMERGLGTDNETDFNGVLCPATSTSSPPPFLILTISSRIPPLYATQHTPCAKLHMDESCMVPR